MINERTTTKFLRESFNLTQKEFSEIFFIPKRTVENWELRNTCPDYVYSLALHVLADLKRRYEEMVRLGSSCEFVDFCKAYHRPYDRK